MTEPCPSAETLSAYLRGTLSSAERAAVEKHVAECDDCFEQLAAAAAFQVEEAGTGKLHPSPWQLAVRRYAAAIAAAVIVAVGLWAWLRLSGPRGEGSPLLALASHLGGAEELEAAASRAWSDEGSGLAFGGGLPPAKRAFRLGVHFLDARVALAAQDEDRFSAALDRIAALLPRQGKAAEVLARLRASANADGRRSRREAEVDEVVAAARAIDPASFDLGAWAELGRLAALGGRTPLLVSEIAARLDDVNAAPTAVDPAVARELRAIGAALADRNVSTEELPRLERSFEQLLLLH